MIHAEQFKTGIRRDCVQATQEKDDEKQRRDLFRSNAKIGRELDIECRYVDVMR
jgi:hypothetical protein